MTTYGLTTTGFVKKTASVCQTEFEDALKAIFGENIDLDSAGPFGQLAQTYAERESLLWDLIEAVYQSAYRNSASGQSLDAALGLVFKSRIQSTYSTVTLTLATLNASDVSVPSGQLIKQGDLNVYWETTAAATIPGASTTVEAVITDVTYQSGNTMRYQLASGTDLSAVVAGDMLNASGCIDANNGLFVITNVSDGSDYVDVTNLNVSSSASNESSITGTANITDGYVTVSARSQLKGAYEANAHTIDTITTPVNNWDYVSNLAVATTGTDEETDTEFRTRAALSSIVATGGTAGAIQNAVEDVEGVTYAQVEQNRTSSTLGGLAPHSVKLTVDGTFTAQNLINAFGAALGAGINTNGSSSGTYTDEQGISETLYYNTVTQVPLYFIVNLTTTASYPSTGDDDVKQAIDDYIATLGRDDDVLNHLVSAAVSNAVTGITAITVLQDTSASPATSANITIGTTERAVVDQANITVNS